MTLVRFNPQLPSLFDRFFDTELFDWANRHFSATNTTMPSVNILETEDHFEVEVAAPGLKKSDFKVQLDRDVLTILSEKRDEKEEKDIEESWEMKRFVCTKTSERAVLCGCDEVRKERGEGGKRRKEQKGEVR